MSAPVHISVLTSGEPLHLSGDGDVEWTVRRHEIGAFEFDGLVVGDLFCEDYNRLEWPCGSPPNMAMAYSVLAEVGPKHERSCFIGLRFSDGSVERWQAADVCCSVDAGVAGFVSADRAESLDEDLLDTCHDHDLLRGLHLDLDGRGFVLASTGWGDGVYEVYWGLGADGVPVWIAVDYEMLMAPITKEYSLSLPLASGEHVLAPGIQVHAVEESVEPVVSLTLPEGQSAQVHVEGPAGRTHARPTGMLSDTEVSYDFSAKNAVALVVQHVVGYAPMRILSNARSSEAQR